MPYSMGDAIGYIKLNIKDYEEKFAKVKSDTEQMDAIADGLGNVFDKAAKLIVAAFTAISAAAAGALKSTIDVGSSFEASMSQVAATLGMSADEIANNSEEFQRLSEAAKEAGNTTRFTAAEASSALNYLALAGYSVEESIQTLPVVLDLAAAGGMDLARASDMVTDAMSALGLPLEEATSFTDKLARTAQRSNTSVEQLGEAILQIGGTAKSLSGGVDELDTALGILANNGIKSAEAGTALRQVILNLTAPSDKAKEYMDSIGFSAYDLATGALKPLNQTFAELAEIVDNANTQMEKDEIITNIFDARQLKSARALLAGYGDSWNELYEEIENADGAAHRMAETMEENLQGAATKAKSALEGVQITAYEALEEGLTKSVKAATGSITQLNDILKSPEMQKSLQKIGDMLGDVLTKFADFAANKAIPNLINLFSNLDKVATAVKSAIAGIAAALPLLITGLILCSNQFKLFIAQLIAAKAGLIAFTAELLTNPFTWIAVAIGAVVAALVNYTTTTKNAIEAAKNQTTEFSRAADAARENANALNEYRQESAEIADAKTDEINQLRIATNSLGEYADKTELTADEMSVVESLIEELNELYPENTAYIRDGQVVGYEELAKSVKKYTDELYYAQKLEANKEKYLSARQIVEDTTKALEGSDEAIERAQENFDKWDKISNLNAKRFVESLLGASKDRESLYSSVYWDEVSQGAKEAGLSVDQYIRAQKAAAEQQLKDAQDAQKLNKETLEQAKKDVAESEKDMLSLRIKSGEKIEGIYADETEAHITTMQKEGERIQAINQAKHQKEIDAQKKAADEREKAYGDMWEDIAELDRKWQLRQIGSEEEYQQKRKELLETVPDEYDDKWVKEYNKSLVYREQFNEKQQSETEKQAKDLEKIREDEIEQQFKDLEYRAEIDEKYTKEMMIKDKEIIVDGLDKNSDLYKKFNQELIDDKKDLVKETIENNKRIAESDFQTWQSSYNSLVSEAENAYKQIQSDQDNLMKSLTSGIKLYDTESKKVWDKQSRSYKTEEITKVNTKSIKEQADETENYIKTLEKLKDKIPDTLMSDIYAMDREEGQKFAEELSKMSDSELKTYTDNYNRIYEASKEFTDKLYSEQLTDFREEYANKFNDIFKDVPKNLELVGQDSIDGFVKGIEEKSSKATGALQDLFAGENGVLAKTKEALDIHSPSGEFEEIGINSIDGFFKGIKSKVEMVVDIFKTLGQSAGESFTNSFQSAWDNFAANFRNGLSTMSFASQFVTPTGQQIPQNYLGTAFSGYNNQKEIPQNISYQNYSNKNVITKQDITNAIKEAMPDGNVILQVDGQQFGLISRKQLNVIASQSGNLNLKN